MMPGAAGSTTLRATVIAIAAAAVVLLCVPVVASAASVEASPVVTVEGSVVSVDGTVTVAPVVLSTATVTAIGDAVASSLSTGLVATVIPDANTLSFYKLMAGGLAISTIALSTLVGLRVGGR